MDPNELLRLAADAPHTDPWPEASTVYPKTESILALPSGWYRVYLPDIDQPLTRFIRDGRCYYCDPAEVLDQPEDYQPPYITREMIDRGPTSQYERFESMQ